MVTAQAMAREYDIVSVCQALGISRASFYRHRQPRSQVKQVCTKPERGLSPLEQQAVVEVLSSEQFLSKTPAQIYTALLNQGIYLCSTRTMYRILAHHPRLKEQRQQASVSQNNKVDSWVIRPNQLWSWEIIRLSGPDRHTFYYLYIILDGFSRYVVGWRVAQRESGSLIGQLIHETCKTYQIKTSQLVLRSERSSSTTPKSFEHLLSQLGVTHGYGCSQGQNSSSFCNSQLKNLQKHQKQPRLPGQFRSLEEAHNSCSQFFHWYNHQHYSQIRGLTPVALYFSSTQPVGHSHPLALSTA